MTVVSGLRLSRSVRLTLAVPFCPVFSVSENRSLGWKPSALRDTNSPAHDCRPELASVTVTLTGT